MLIFSIKSVNKLFFKKITELKPNGEKPRSRSPGRLEASISPVAFVYRIACIHPTPSDQIPSAPNKSRHEKNRATPPTAARPKLRKPGVALGSRVEWQPSRFRRCPSQTRSPEEKRLRRGVGEFRVEPGFDSVIGRRNGGARGGGAGDTGGGGGVADAAGQGATQDQAEAPPGGGQRRKRRQGADGRGDRGQATPGASPEAGVFVFSLLPHVT